MTKAYETSEPLASGKVRKLQNGNPDSFGLISNSMRDAISEILANNLARLLELRDISALALGERIGMGRSSVYDILQGRSASPKVSTVAKLAAGLGVPLTEMFMTPEQLAAQSEIVQLYDLLPAEEQRRVAQVVRAWSLD